jgi:hypothetical protein
MPLPTGATFLTEIQNSPLDFLRQYHLKIVGKGGEAEGGVVEFAFSDRNDAYTGFTKLPGQTKQRTSIKLAPIGSGDRAGDFLVNDNHRIWAHYVPMRKAADTLTYAYRMPWPGDNQGTNANPNLMLTSEISGCTFAIGPLGGNTRAVIHIQPDRAITPAAARNTHQQGTVDRIIGTANRHLLFSRDTHGNDYASNRMSVVGVRRDGVWSFYAQFYNQDQRSLIKVVKIMTS